MRAIVCFHAMWARCARTPVWMTVLWLTASAAGFYRLIRYELTPGRKAAASPRHWPSRSAVQPRGDRFHLVLFAHPKCPCTRASISELAVLMAHCQGRLETYVFLLRPAEVAPGWERTDLAESASAIPGVQVIPDPGGAEAAIFGAETSGQALLYDLRGDLVFEGGITPSRGHSGDNDGRDAVLAIVLRGEPAAATAPVFGCSLRDPEQAAADGGER